MSWRSVARRAGAGRVRDAVRGASWWVSSTPRRLKDLDPDRRVPVHAVALTFDDGPDPGITPSLLRLLDKHAVHATFFMCGMAAQRHPDLVRSVAAEGHTIGGHSWDHRRPVRELSEPEWTRQIVDTHSLLADLAQTPIRWFRPPWGNTDRATRDRLRRNGVATVRWSTHGRDWTRREADEIAATVLESLEPGGVVLLHDAIADADRPNGRRSGPDQTPTLEATGLLLDIFADRGWTSVGLDVIPAGTMPRLAHPRRPSVARATGGRSSWP